MIMRMFMFALTMAMIGCLTAYAVDHVSTARDRRGDSGIRTIAGPVTGPGGEPLRPLRPMNDEELAAADQERARQRQEALNREMAQRDDEIILQLGLDEEQMRQYLALREEIRAQSEELKTFKGNRIDRGMEINQQLHAALREIFAPEQYDLYRKLWNVPSTAIGIPADVQEDCQEQDGAEEHDGERSPDAAAASNDHPW